MDRSNRNTNFYGRKENDEDGRNSLNMNRDNRDRDRGGRSSFSSRPSGKQEYGPSHRSWGEDTEKNWDSYETREDQSFNPHSNRGFSYGPDAHHGAQEPRRRHGLHDYGSRGYQDYRTPVDTFQSQEHRGPRNLQPGLSEYEQSSYGGSVSPKNSYRGKGPKNYSRTDERIREDICQKLMDDDDIDALDMEVKVEGGVITLEGMVNSKLAKYRAEDLAEQTSGATDVDNRLKVYKAQQNQNSGQNSDKDERSNPKSASKSKSLN